MQQKSTKRIPDVKTVKDLVLIFIKISFKVSVVDISFSCDGH